MPWSLMATLAETEQADLTRKSVPWIFYGQTTSLCETCWELVPAKIIGQDGKVYFQKRCPEHGVSKTLIEEDPAYWLDIRHWLKPGDRPQSRRGAGGHAPVRVRRLLHPCRRRLHALPARQYRQLGQPRWHDRHAPPPLARCLG